VTEVGSTLVHRVLDPRSAGNAGTHPTVILLHGRGADENDLAGLSSFLDPRLFFLSLRAPYPFPVSGGFTWYEMADDGTPDAEMFRESYDRLTAFIAEARRDYPVDPERIFILGFSMGTMMALCLALTDPGRFRGVIANSGYLPEGTGLDMRWNELAGMSIFLAHGTHDPVIPISLARKTRDLLQKSDASLVYREYPMGHEISSESLLDVSDWMKNLIEDPPGISAGN